MPDIFDSIPMFKNYKIKKTKKIGEKKMKEKERIYKQKIDKCKKLFVILRELYIKMDSFIYNISAKPSDILEIEDSTNKIMKRIPKFSGDERQNFLRLEYKLVKKHFICLECKRDLNDVQVNNDNIEKQIICNDCGMMYYKLDSEDKKVRSAEFTIPQFIHDHTTSSDGGGFMVNNSPDEVRLTVDLADNVELPVLPEHPVLPVLPEHPARPARPEATEEIAVHAPVEEDLRVVNVEERELQEPIQHLTPEPPVFENIRFNNTVRELASTYWGEPIVNPNEGNN